MGWSVCGLSCYFSLLSCFVGSELCIGYYAFLLNEMNDSVSKKKKKTWLKFKVFNTYHFESKA